MLYDPNTLEKSGRRLMEAGAFGDALKVYFELADGDPSLDAGYTAMRIGECYERLGDPHAARYWYGRALAENPTISEYRDARKRFDDLDLSGVIGP